MKLERLFHRHRSKPHALLRLGHRQERRWEQDPCGIEPPVLELELLEVSKPEPDLRVARGAALEERFERCIDVLQLPRLCDELDDRSIPQEELVAHAVRRERDVLGSDCVVEDAEHSLALPDRVQVVEADILSVPLPTRPFRAIGSLPFGQTTGILHHLLDNPTVPLERADVVVQWEVARKRAAVPPSTMLSTAWAPWWEFRLGPRIPAAGFRPIPRVDAGVLVITRRSRPLLPVAMARRYADFVRAHWPV